jgi:hypothetical protein
MEIGDTTRVRTRIGLCDSMLWMRSEQVEQVPATSQFGYYKQLVVDTKDIVEPNDVFMSPQFTQDIDFLL